MATSNAYTDSEGMLRFEIDMPVRCALQSTDGKSVEGRYGERLLFSAVDGRQFYLPPTAREKIAALGIRAGEPITITKVETRVKGKKGVAYNLERDATAAAAAPAPRTMAVAPAPGPVALPAPVSTEPNIRRYLYDTYKVAIDVLVEAQKYGQARGMPVTFTAEDVRSLAATILIQRGGPWPQR